MCVPNPLRVQESCFILFLCSVKGPGTCMGKHITVPRGNGLSKCGRGRDDFSAAFFCEKREGHDGHVDHSNRTSDLRI